MRKATLASILRKSRPGVRLNEHLEHPGGLTVFQHPARWGWRILSKTARVALSFGPISGLAQFQQIRLRRR